MESGAAGVGWEGGGFLSCSFPFVQARFAVSRGQHSWQRLRGVWGRAAQEKLIRPLLK